jgi:hypothetical protein
VQINATPITEDGNTPTRAIAVIRDVTAHHEAMLELDRSHTELEQRVLERTRELAEINRKLQSEITAKKRLERAILDAAERESRRIGQELHDHLCQQILGITFATKVFARDLERADPARSEKLHELAKLLNEAVKSCRDLVRGLSFFHSDDLLAAVASLANQASKQIPCEVDCPVEISLSNVEAARHVYRIAQEAVENALKHSKATRIIISVKEARGKMTVKIADDGCGFDPQEQKESLGLLSMKFRAQAIQGKLDIDSKPENGTRVSCTFSINQPN